MIDDILSRLTRVRDRGHGRFNASCPTSAHAHGDRSQGLSLRDTGNGTVLVYCHAGCTPDEIMAAIGLTLADLFPAREDGYQPTQAPKWPLRDLLQIIRHEAMVAHVGAEKLARGEGLTAADRERLGVAAHRIRIAAEAGGVRYA